MSNKMDIFNQNKVFLLDGSFGSQLIKYTKKNIDIDPLWTARALYLNPDAVIKVHMDFIKAGANIIETNSYQASIPGFMKYLNISEKESYELIKKSVYLVKEAIKLCKEEGFKDVPLIAGSVGAYGAFLHDGSEYTGSYIDTVSEEELVNFHKPRIAALIEGGIDLLAIETIPCKKEAEIIVDLLKEFPSIKAWLSFTCQSNNITTAYGETLGEAVKNCYEKNPQQILAVGVNCIAPSSVESLLKDINLKIKNQVPLIAYANSGEIYQAGIGWHHSKESLEPYIPLWLNLGVKYIGACCRVCADDISKIGDEIKKWKKSNGVIDNC